MSFRGSTVPAAIAVLAMLTVGVGSAEAGELWLSTAHPDQVLAADVSQAAAPDVLVLGSDAGGIDLTVMLQGVELADRQTKAGGFVEVAWPDAPLYGQIGSPALPVVRRLFVGPHDAQIDIDMTMGRPIQLSLDMMGFGASVLPVQGPIEKLPGARERAPFDYDQAVYAIDSFAPEGRVEVTKLGVVRGNQLYMLEVRPLAYNPARGEMMVWPEIEVNLDFVGGRYQDSVGQLTGLDGVLLNPPANANPTGDNYLIVVAEAYAGTIGSFVTGKQAQGYDVQTYEVPQGTSNTTIRDYIQSLWGTDSEPSYVLLVGDTDKIPCWVGSGSGSPDTDIYYVCMDGGDDWYPDIPIGRFSIRSTDDLQDVIDKTLFIEAQSYPDQEYVLRAVFMASEDNYTVSEGTHNYCIDTHLDPAGFTSDKLYCHTYNATTQQVTDAFNDGRIYGVYSGHGYSTGWADGPAFDPDNVEALTNEGMYSVVYSFACSTGDFKDTTECFTETWVRVANKGAATIYGSSVSSYWTEDDILEKRLFDVIYDDDIREVSASWQAAFLLYLDHFGPTSTTRRYFEMYNLMGDPSLYIPLPGGGADLQVSPFGSFDSEGPNGGPFTPESKTYIVKNNADYPITYSVSRTADWIDLDNTGGTLAVGGAADVTVSINANANNLPNGHYEDLVEFVNETNHDGDSVRLVTLEVGVPVPVITFDLGADPGWSVEGEWAFGAPTGQGGSSHGNPDPDSGFTGDNVYGINLYGDYSTDIGGPYYLTTNAIDCSDLTSVSVHFQRWLNSDYQSYVYQTFDASNDGVNWTEIWDNGGDEIAENSWSEQAYDVSAIADGQASVYLRWGHEVASSGAYAYSGWNIDDIAIWGIDASAPCPWDVNDTGIVDIEDAFGVLAHWGEGPGQYDVNDDGEVDIDDIFAVLDHWGYCP